MVVQSTKKPSENQPEESFQLSASPYKRIWRFSILLTFVVALTPLIIMTVVNYHQDKESYRIESRFAVAQILSNTKRSIEFLIEERRSALALIVSEKTYNSLSTNDGLMSVLRNLKRSFGGFIDLGLIDMDGTQREYAGPYALKGKNYKDQSWFHEVGLRGIYVSDMFMGYRNFPHFVIAVKHEKESDEYYVLRATIDMELLNQHIYSLDLDRSTDAFIINHKGVLQTTSMFNGEALEKRDFKIPAYSRNREIIEEVTVNGKRNIFGYAYIESSPFILVANKILDNPLRTWISHQYELLLFLVISVIAIMIFGFSRSTYMVNRLRKSDQQRAKVFHNIEYTNKMATIGRMAASVAHEINNPLAIINEKAGLLKDMANFLPDYPKKEKTISIVDSILNSVVRCSNVTHRLLGFAKRMDIRKELIDLELLMKEVVGFLGKEALHRSIEINFDIPPNLPNIESDRGQLQQIFLNLINNAFAAVDEGGKISISIAERKDNEMTIAISDNGSGIPEENLKNIFEPFFSTKGEFGTGLGLSITQDIVTKLGGRIDVESEVGKGTRFIITLPLKKTDYVE